MNQSQEINRMKKAVDTSSSEARCRLIDALIRGATPISDGKDRKRRDNQMFHLTESALDYFLKVCQKDQVHTLGPPLPPLSLARAARMTALHYWAMPFDYNKAATWIESCWTTNGSTYAPLRGASYQVVGGSNACWPQYGTRSGVVSKRKKDGTFLLSGYGPRPTAVTRDCLFTISRHGMHSSHTNDSRIRRYYNALIDKNQSTQADQGYKERLWEWCNRMSSAMSEGERVLFEAPEVTGNKPLFAYEVREKLGQGSYSQVFGGVRQLTSGGERQVVFKVFKAKSRRKIKTEFDLIKRLTKTLKVPNVINLECDTLLSEAVTMTPIMCLEACRDRLGDFRLCKSKTSLREIATIMRQVLECLAALHEHQILHRDIKHANVMVVGFGGSEIRVRVIDWGLATDNSAKKPTDSFGIAGTPHWRAPELLLGTHLVSDGGAIDMWSAGCVLGHLLFGGSSSPFKFGLLPKFKARSTEELRRIVAVVGSEGLQSFMKRRPPSLLQPPAINTALEGVPEGCNWSHSSHGHDASLMGSAVQVCPCIRLSKTSGVTEERPRPIKIGTKVQAKCAAGGKAGWYDGRIEAISCSDHEDKYAILFDDGDRSANCLRQNILIRSLKPTPCPELLKQLSERPRSSAALALLGAMLECDPEKRITADTALRHPFFSPAGFAAE